MAHTDTAPAAVDLGAYQPQLLALVCERSVPLDELVGPDQKLVGAPNVHVLRFPCSGMIKPSLAQLALDEGWDGVIIVGCSVGDCHFREGNLFARDRFLGERAPNKFKRMDQTRVQLLWHAIPEGEAFLAHVRSFAAKLAALPPNVRKADGQTKKRR